MAEYKVTPMKDRTICGRIAVVSFVSCISFLLWALKLSQDNNI